MSDLYREPIELDVTFLHCTDAAVLVEFDEEEIWIPRSQITCTAQLSLCDRGDLIEIEIPEWLAFEKGMI